LGKGEKSLPIWGEIQRGVISLIMKKDITQHPIYFNTSIEVLGRARKLRNHTTEVEKIIWKYLRRKQIDGYKFRRQHPIGKYIADFYCHEAKLVVEVDGKIHLTEKQKEHDEKRTKYLEELGIKIVRVTNEKVIYRIDEVVGLIQQNLPHP
jgi:very-short-patch-repair endonuclease